MELSLSAKSLAEERQRGKRHNRKVYMCVRVLCACVTQWKRREGDICNDKSMVIGSAGRRERPGAARRHMCW